MFTNIIALFAQCAGRHNPLEDVVSEDILQKKKENYTCKSQALVPVKPVVRYYTCMDAVGDNFWVRESLGFAFLKCNDWVMQERVPQSSHFSTFHCRLPEHIMLLWLEHQFPNQNQKGPRTSQKEKKKKKPMWHLPYQISDGYCECHFTLQKQS